MKGIYPFLIVVAADKQNEAIIGFSGEVSGIWGWKTTYNKNCIEPVFTCKIV